MLACWIGGETAGPALGLFAKAGLPDDSVVLEQTPSPQPSASTFACPGGWVVVDADGDDAIDGADRCERVIETSAAGQLPADTLPVVALVVTMVLLLASIGIGAARWGSVMPPRR